MIVNALVFLAFAIMVIYVNVRFMTDVLFKTKLPTWLLVAYFAFTTTLIATIPTIPFWAKL